MVCPRAHLPKICPPIGCTITLPTVRSRLKTKPRKWRCTRYRRWGRQITERIRSASPSTTQERINELRYIPSRGRTYNLRIRESVRSADGGWCRRTSGRLLSVSFCRSLSALALRISASFARLASISALLLSDMGPESVGWGTCCEVVRTEALRRDQIGPRGICICC